MDAVRKKYVNEKFFKRGNPIDMDQKAIKNVLLPTKEGDAANKSYVDSKSAGGSDFDMGGHLVKNVRWPEEDHDLVNRAYVYFVAGKRLPIEGGTMQEQIDMGEHSIRNINPNPQNEDELVPKQWIEENFLNRYNPASTMAVDLNMDGRHVSYLREPEQNHHAVTKGYADTKPVIPKRRAAKTPLPCHEVTVLHDRKYKAKIYFWCCRASICWPKMSGLSYFAIQIQS